MDANTFPQHQRLGYLTSFDGLGLATPLASDLEVYFPYQPGNPAHLGQTPNPKLKVAGMLSDLDWNGRPDDPLTFRVHVSGSNAALLAQRKTTVLKSLGFWVGNFDSFRNIWFEECCPIVPVLTGPMETSGLIINANQTEVAQHQFVELAFQVTRPATQVFQIRTVDWSNLRIGQEAMAAGLYPWGQSPPSRHK